VFMSLMTPDAIRHLAILSDEQWRAYARRWESERRVVLYDEVKEILTRAVCAWVGVPLAEAEVRGRTRDLALLFETGAAVGPKHWRGRLARKRAEAWIAGLVEEARGGRLEAPEGSPLHAIAHHRDADGTPLEPRVAAVEVLNLLRPTVAVAVYVAFVAVALHDHPAYRDRIRAGEDALLEPFVQEVRRFYPFFPFMGARVRTDFEWRGHRFPAGTKVLLDLYGTNHDPRIWSAPGAFRPERFAGRDIDPFELIPQGGADHFSQHRCAGEWITIELMKRAARFLAREIRYEVPPQDLRIRMNRIPAIPESGFVMTGVRTTG
jgi:fatty-acid peroxygenase